MSRLLPAYGRALFFIVLVSLAGPAQAENWPPVDPGQPRTRVRFDPTWALAVRDIRDFVRLQQAAGAPGRLSEVVRGEAPHAVYEWTGADGSRLRVLRYETGDFGAIGTPGDGRDPIIFNSFGAFVCAACVPPVSACGHRPSWVPRDLHWDNFDCRCTLTGPQSLAAGRC